MNLPEMSFSSIVLMFLNVLKTKRTRKSIGATSDLGAYNSILGKEQKHPRSQDVEKLSTSRNVNQKRVLGSISRF